MKSIPKVGIAAVVSLTLLAIGFFTCDRIAPEIDKGQRFYESSYTGVPTLENSIVQWQLHHMLNLKSAIDVMFVGDSSCLMGIEPSIVSERTGLKCWNIGTLAWLGTQGHALVLEKYLRTHAAPKLVIYHIAPWCLFTSDSELAKIGYSSETQNWLSDNRKTSRVSGIRRMRLISDHWFRRILNRDFTSVMEISRPPYPSDEQVRKVLLTNCGFFPEARKYNFVSAEKAIEDLHPACSDSRVGLAKLHQLSRRYNFRLLVYVNPIPQDMNSPRIRTRYAEYESYIRETLKDDVVHKSPMLTVYPVDCCVNLSHLSPAGARRHSNEIAEDIRKYIQL